MAYSEMIIQGTMNNPEVAAVGFAAGFIIAKALGLRNRGMGGMGGTI
jgi:hypothetical protein